jgi:hypothetical protein
MAGDATDIARAARVSAVTLCALSCEDAAVKKLLLLVLACAGCMNSDLDQAIDNGAKKLGKADAEAALTDHTLVGSIPHLNLDFILYYGREGRLMGALKGPIDGRDRGAWRVASDGKVCLRWSSWEEGEETCRELWRQGESFMVFDDTAGRMVSLAQRERGNARKLELKSDLERVREKEKLEPVSATLLRELVPGNTLTGPAPPNKNAVRHTFFGKDQRVFTDLPSEVIKDRGKYRIQDDGTLCATWGYLQGGKERCERWFKSEKGYWVFDGYDVLTVSGKLREGNPEKLGE